MKKYPFAPGVIEEPECSSVSRMEMLGFILLLLSFAVTLAVLLGIILGWISFAEYLA